MAHFALWGAILFGAVSATQFAAYSGTRFVVTASLVLPQAKQSASLIPAAALPAATSAPKTATATPASVQTAEASSAAIKLADAAGAATGPAAGPQVTNAAAPAQVPSPPADADSPSAPAKSAEALEAGELSKSPRAAQIEPMVEPVKRQQPKAPDIKVKIETGSIERTAAPKSARSVKLVSDKPNCDAGFKLDSTRKSCVRVASTAQAKKKRR